MGNSLTVDSKSFVDTLLNSDKIYSVIEAYGNEEVSELQTLSRGLNIPIKNLANMDSENNKIASSLVDLKTNVEKINPGKFDLEPGWFGRLSAYVTGSTAVNKYVSKFQTTQSVIDAIIRSLKDGKRTLEQDVIVFEEDLKRYRDTNEGLNNKLLVLRDADTKLNSLIESESNEERKRFLQEDIAFPLKQRILDLQQTSAVAGQGALSLNILIKNNKELIRGVNRAANVTVSALTIGATILLGLNNQREVLNKINEVNTTTNQLIIQTSEILKTQGAEIQKQASSTSIDINSLKTALTNVISAIEDVETFRREALPNMSQAILELNDFSTKISDKIQRMDS